ncbi:MAG: hypothetical protein CM1200mP26_23330 [Acidimicrobiales bacterium]|nr:MAG: hypothetical protein CM1200mP26_23330 [Acidimicrobiales bacterium]
MVGTVSQLEVEALVKILVEPKNALIKQYQRLFEFENVELDVDDDALVAIAEHALERGTGARGLRAILEDVLLDVMYELPGDDEAGRVVVDLETVKGGCGTDGVSPQCRAARPRSVLTGPDPAVGPSIE